MLGCNLQSLKNHYPLKVLLSEFTAFAELTPNISYKFQGILLHKNFIGRIDEFFISG